MNLTGFYSVLFFFIFLFFASHILEGSVQQPLLQPGSPYYMFFFFSLGLYVLQVFGSFQCAYVDLPHTFSFILLWWSPHLSFHDFLFLFTGRIWCENFFFSCYYICFQVFLLCSCYAAVEELYTQDKGESATLQNWKSNGLKLSDSTKEPYVGSLQNLLLYYPGVVCLPNSLF